MAFSVNFAWMRNGALAPDLSISLSAIVHGAREPFWSISGKFAPIRFLLLPHFRSEATITVRSERPAVPSELEKKSTKPMRRPRPPLRPVWTNLCAFACRWRL